MTAEDAAQSPHAEGPASPRRDRLGDPRLHVAAIIALALVPRLVYLFQIQRWPDFYQPILDSHTQYSWSLVLLRTLGIGNNEVLAKAPLYTYYLALVQLLLGEGRPALFGARAIQLLLGAVVCGMTYSLGRRVFGAGVGLLAGGFLALYSPALFREGQLLDTAVATLLTLGFVLALLAVLDRPTGARWFGLGLLLGVLGLTRPNLLSFAAVALGAMVVVLRRAESPRGLARLAGIFALGIVLPILPITVRNYLVSNELIWISTNGPINLYTGNRPGADGISPIPSGIAWERTWYEARQAGAISPRTQGQYWLRKVREFWREHPGEALALLLRKAYAYWNAYEVPNNLSYDWGRQHASMLRILPLTFGVLGPLALLGIALGGWRSRDSWVLTLIVLAHMLAVIVFFFCGRYRMPAVPILSVFASYAVFSVVRLAKGRRWGALGGAALGLVVLALLVNSDAYGARRSRAANRDWFYIGRALGTAQRLPEAREALERAIADDPEDADAWVFLGLAQQSLGDLEAAARSWRQALRVAPDYTSAAVYLADLHLDQGWPVEEVEPLLSHAVELQPGNVLGLSALTRVNIRLGHYAAAEANLARAAAEFAYWHPTDRRTQQVRGQLGRAVTEARLHGVPVPAGF